MDRYKKTIETYQRMGKKYLNDTKDIIAQDFFKFIKLISHNGKVLDVGCAGGKDTKRFIQKGFKVIGIDLVDIFLKEAKKALPQAKFVKMDLLKLKFPKDYFDALWANAVLLHIKKKDIPLALREFYKVLKFGGKLYLQVKTGKGTGYKKDKLSSGEKRFFSYFSEDEIKQYVKRAGFEIIKSRIVSDAVGRKDTKWISLWAGKA